MSGTKRNWAKNYQIVYSYYRTRNQAKKLKLSHRSFCEFLGISLGKREKWQKGQWPSAEDLNSLHNKLGFSYRWLITGEGDPFEEVPQGDADLEKIFDLKEDSGTKRGTELERNQCKIYSIPLRGFASCDINGWHGSLVFTVPVSLPQLTSDTIAVLADGDSMLPLGIGSGQICFCDPHLEAVHGDAVYVERVDGYCTIKQYMDKKHMPEGKVPEGYMLLRGWQNVEEDKPQKPFDFLIEKKIIKIVAPVVLIRRRL